MKKMKKTLCINEETFAKLREFGKFGQTYDELLNNMVVELKKKRGGMRK